MPDEPNPEEAEAAKQDREKKAQRLLEEGRAARAAGDQQTLNKINAQITEDPELQRFMREHAVLGNELVDMSKIIEKIDAVNDTVQRLMALGREAHARGASTESLFSQEEMERVELRMRNLKSRVEDPQVTAETVKQILQQTGEWFTQTEKVLQERVRHLRGYFGSELPEALSIQVRMFDGAKTEFAKIVPSKV